MDRPVADLKDRLRDAMNIRDVNSSELSRRTKIPKSSVSQYLSGYARPKDDRVYAISKALNVNEGWLLGFDAPMERKPKAEITDVSDEAKQIALAYDNADARTKVAVEVALGIDFEKKNVEVRLSS